MNIDRTVSLMDAGEVAADFDIELADDMKMWRTRERNKITNDGDNAWTKEGGLVSVWMLGCFNPTPTTTVFIPYKENAEGVIVNDEYFGKIPADRLIKENGIIYFKIDGLYRSKLDCRLHAQRIYAEAMIHRRACSPYCGAVFPKPLQFM